MSIEQLSDFEPKGAASRRLRRVLRAGRRLRTARSSSSGPTASCVVGTGPSRPGTCPARTSSSTASPRAGVAARARRRRVTPSPSSRDVARARKSKICSTSRRTTGGGRARRAGRSRPRSGRCRSSGCRRRRGRERVGVVPERVGAADLVSTKRWGGSHPGSCRQRDRDAVDAQPVLRAACPRPSRSGSGVRTRKRSSGGVIASRLRASAKNGEDLGSGGARRRQLLAAQDVDVRHARAARTDATAAPARG